VLTYAVSQGGPVFSGRYFNDVFEQAADIWGEPFANGAHHMKKFKTLPANPTYSWNHKLTLGFKHISAMLFLVGIMLPAAHPAAAQTSPEPYCLFREEFAPDGLLLKMANRYFRVCSVWSDSEIGRQHILRINPARVKGLENDYAASNLRLDARLGIETHIAAFLRYKLSNGTHTFGDTTYQAFESEIRGPNGFPGSASYIYDPLLKDQGKHFPMHYVTCAGEAWLESKNSLLQCNVWVWKDGVMASLNFIGGRGRSMEFTKHFANFAVEIVKVLETADVTDEFEELRLFLDVVE
jgi:hypothetical protein